MVSLVPSQSFRANYRATSLKLPIHAPQRELTGDIQGILHTILNLLLQLLRQARTYTDILVHGPGKMSAYFGLLTYFMVTKTEKLMVNYWSKILYFFSEKLMLFLLFLVEPTHSRFMGIVSSSTIRAERTSSSQQTGIVSILASRDHRLSRKCASNC